MPGQDERVGGWHRRAAGVPPKPVSKPSAGTHSPCLACLAAQVRRSNLARRAGRSFRGEGNGKGRSACWGCRGVGQGAADTAHWSSSSSAAAAADRCLLCLLRPCSRRPPPNPACRPSDQPNSLSSTTAFVCCSVQLGTMWRLRPATRRIQPLAHSGPFFLSATSPCAAGHHVGNLPKGRGRGHHPRGPPPPPLQARLWLRRRRGCARLLLPMVVALLLHALLVLLPVVVVMPLHVCCCSCSRCCCCCCCYLGVKFCYWFV